MVIHVILLMKNIKNIYNIGQNVGLSKEEIYDILNDITKRKEQPSFSIGPSCYPGSWYATVSIKDF